MRPSLIVAYENISSYLSYLSSYFSSFLISILLLSARQCSLGMNSFSSLFSHPPAVSSSLYPLSTLYSLVFSVSLHLSLNTSSASPPPFLAASRNRQESRLSVQPAVPETGIKWFTYSHILILVVTLARTQTCKLGQIWLPECLGNDIHTSTWIETGHQEKNIHLNALYPFIKSGLCPIICTLYLQQSKILPEAKWLSVSAGWRVCHLLVK